MTVEPRMCAGNGGNCQFSEHADADFKHEGKMYCLLHLPLESTAKRPDDFMNQLRHVVSKRIFDLSHVQFPDAAAVKIDNGDLLTFDHCVFGSVTLQLRKARITRSHMRGGLKLLLRGGPITVEDVEFSSPLEIHADEAKSITFRRVCFRGRVTLSHPVTGDWWFDKVRFDAPLVLRHDVEKVPQQMSFHRTSFRRGSCKPSVEGSYRHWRTLFANNSDRENEGLFYALEKRSHRRGLPFYSPSRCVSAIYDVVSVYGQSYERAFGAFLALQVIMAIVYAGASGRLHWQQPLDGQSTMQVTAFTLAQIAKPFELMSSRGPDTQSVLSLVTDNRATWAFWTFLHSVVSLVLLALMVLAFRWRFRRA